jgi:ubiquinone/menaquinone biosynthesis C-methylase UbiE
MFSNPDVNVAQLGLLPGMQVADLGSGSGHYSMAAARAVGAGGTVFAVDVQKELLTKLQNSAQKAGLHNINILWGDLDMRNGTKLKDAAVDVAIVANIFFQIERKEAFIEELLRIVRPNGKVLVVDWSDSFGGIGPAPEQVVTEAQALAFFEKYHFTKVADIKAGEHHYGFVLKTPEAGVGEEARKRARQEALDKGARTIAPILTNPLTGGMIT